ncbi:hypothetical protein BT63DRAFT_482728 [Microthyrium microscopicum]|uniref:Uncharacterized protein n=1 Tax=Microthyrium microscopicum TaxID=703497 RepID=A0A6A6U163_9PEZI|nr:hypothetical protein BT63DRAFT_482728 [Microthyrium microscopicum]
MDGSSEFVPNSFNSYDGDTKTGGLPVPEEYLDLFDTEETLGHSLVGAVPTADGSLSAESNSVQSTLSPQDRSPSEAVASLGQDSSELGASQDIQEASTNLATESHTPSVSPSRPSSFLPPSGSSIFQPVLPGHQRVEINPTFRLPSTSTFSSSQYPITPSANRQANASNGTIIPTQNGHWHVTGNRAQFSGAPFPVNTTSNSHRTHQFGSMQPLNGTSSFQTGTVPAMSRNVTQPGMAVTNGPPLVIPNVLRNRPMHPNNMAQNRLALASNAGGTFVGPATNMNGLAPTPVQVQNTQPRVMRPPHRPNSNRNIQMPSATGVPWTQLPVWQLPDGSYQTLYCPYCGGNARWIKGVNGDSDRLEFYNGCKALQAHIHAAHGKTPTDANGNKIKRGAGRKAFGWLRSICRGPTLAHDRLGDLAPAMSDSTIDPAMQAVRNAGKGKKAAKAEAERLRKEQERQPRDPHASSRQRHSTQTRTQPLRQAQSYTLASGTPYTHYQHGGFDPGRNPYARTNPLGIPTYEPPVSVSQQPRVPMPMMPQPPMTMGRQAQDSSLTVNGKRPRGVQHCWEEEDSEDEEEDSEEEEERHQRWKKMRKGRE